MHHVGVRRHKGGGHHEEEHENEERWLVSFADMMTLLFCLFMVLFAISSVNTSKFKELQKSLQDAFSGAVLSGGKSMMNTGSADEHVQGPGRTASALAAPDHLAQHHEPEVGRRGGEEGQAGGAGLPGAQAPGRQPRQGRRPQGKVKVTVRRRGLVIQLLTDKVFFASGQATLKPEATSWSTRSPASCATSAPTRSSSRATPTRSRSPARSTPPTGNFPALAPAAVVRDFVSNGVLARRVSLAGSANQEPIASNSTPEGRAKNRRVEIVLTRIQLHTDTESYPAHGGAHIMVKKIVPVIVLLLALGGGYKFVLAKPAKAEVKPKLRVHGTVYMLQKEFLVNLADGRFAKMQIGLVLAHKDVSTVPRRRPRGGHAARGLRRHDPGGRRPRRHHRSPDRRQGQRADRREGPRAPQGGNPQGDQGPHRCKGRARPVLRPHRSVRAPNGRNRRLRTFRDHHGRSGGAVAPHPATAEELSRLHDVSVELAVEVGRTQMTIREALALGPGSIVTLNRLAGEPVDLLVNGKPIARGEVVVIDEEFGLRVTEVLAPKGADAPDAATGARRCQTGIRAVCIARRPHRRRFLAQGVRGRPHRPRGDGGVQPAAVDLPARADRAVRRRPRAALAELAASVIADARTIFPTAAQSTLVDGIRRLQQSSTTVGIVAVVSSLWVGASFWGALDTAFCRIYHLPCRSWVRQKLFGFGMLAVVLVFIAASVVVPTVQALPVTARRTCRSASARRATSSTGRRSGSAW